MAYNKQLISAHGNEAGRLANIGNKIAIYRNCANIPRATYAERCGITAEELDGVEKGYCKLTLQQILRFAEELGVGYADLYEANDDRYYTNVKDDAAFEYVFRKMREFSYLKIAETLEQDVTFLYNLKRKRYIPSPFLLGNILTLLKINSVELRNAGIYAAKEVKEEKTVETPPEAAPTDVMAEVAKAINVYKNVETMRAELNEIVNKATALLEILGA